MGLHDQQVNQKDHNLKRWNNLDLQDLVKMQFLQISHLMNQNEGFNSDPRSVPGFWV